MNYTKAQLTEFKQLVERANHIVVLQAERIDADSLGSAIGLEQVLEDSGKTVTLYCYNDVPSYLHHLKGWERVTADMPEQFDAAILVDSASASQLSRTLSAHGAQLAAKPFVAIDHHPTKDNRVEFITLPLIDSTAGASGQQIVELAEHFGWTFDTESAYALAAAIKADTVNLATKNTTPATLRAMATVVEAGANLETLRLNIEETQGLVPAELPLWIKVLERVRFFHENRIAVTFFTEAEYAQIGEDKLIVEKMKNEPRRLKGVEVAVTITERKGYSNASLRSNVPVARATVEHFGGGGHDNAASCRFMGIKHRAVTNRIVPVIAQLIDEYDAAV